MCREGLYVFVGCKHSFAAYKRSENNIVNSWNELSVSAYLQHFFITHKLDGNARLNDMWTPVLYKKYESRTELWRHNIAHIAGCRTAAIHRCVRCKIQEFTKSPRRRVVLSRSYRCKQ